MSMIDNNAVFITKLGIGTHTVTHMPAILETIQEKIRGKIYQLSANKLQSSKSSDKKCPILYRENTNARVESS